MRLTNISQAKLPSGRMRSLNVRLGNRSAGSRPISFDQARHVGRGDRAGSWTALALRLPSAVDPDELGQAWCAVVARHGTLHTVFSRDETGDLHLTEYPVLGYDWTENPVRPGQATRDAVREVFDAGCRPFNSPSHQVILIEPFDEDDDARPALVIGADHSHVDMWSMLVLARDLLTALDDVQQKKPVASSLPTAPPFAEHTAALRTRPPAPVDVTERWQQILAAGGGVMPRFPLDLGDISQPVDEVVEVRDVLNTVECDQLAAIASAAGVRLLPTVLASLTEATRTLSGRPLRAVFPVHSRYEQQWQQAVGWFVTNAVIECDTPTPTACAADVAEALKLGSHPLAPIFAPIGDMPEAPGMFALSWLDTRRLPVELADTLDIQYVSASLKVDGVMIWFIVNGSGLHLRCRYPGTPEARRNVGTWLGEVVAQVQRDAREPVVRLPQQ